MSALSEMFTGNDPVGVVQSTVPKIRTRVGRLVKPVDRFIYNMAQRKCSSVPDCQAPHPSITRDT